jgi:hypothetical protein
MTLVEFLLKLFVMESTRLFLAFKGALISLLILSLSFYVSLLFLYPPPLLVLSLECLCVCLCIKLCGSSSCSLAFKNRHLRYRFHPTPFSQLKSFKLSLFSLLFCLIILSPVVTTWTTCSNI